MSVTDSGYRDHIAVADEVRVALARRRMSASEAARALGWSQTYMSRRLRGDVSFDVADLFELAKLLRVKVQDFFPEPDPEPTPGIAIRRRSILRVPLTRHIMRSAA